MATTYTVVLPLFEGPLDLLLHLIEERELDITKVSLAAVTDQYVDYISRLEKLEAEKLADFLTIAAKLLLIKSRMLLPQLPTEEEEEEGNVGDELVRQLIEYRKFKTAAQGLRAREEEGLHAYARLLPLPELERSFRLEGVTLDDLVETVRRAILTQKTTSSVNEVVTPLHISLPEKIAQLERLAIERHRFSFNRLLAKAASRMEIIVTFLALLQLIKRRRVAVEQAELFGEIVVSTAS
jgi:segregation and condensation protein A